MLSRIAQTTAALTRLKPVCNDMSISLSSKTCLMCSLVTSIFLYACESWTLTAELQRRIQAMEMRFYCKMLRILYKERPCYQWESPCQDPAGNWTTRRSPDQRKETQTAVVWPCFPFIRSGQNHLARHSEREKKTRRTKEEMGRQHQGMDRPGVHKVPEGSGEQGKMEETGWEIIFVAPTTLVVKRQMMMIIMMIMMKMIQSKTETQRVWFTTGQVLVRDVPNSTSI